MQVDAHLLWACHDCQMIGTEAEARVHRIAKGHPVEQLDEETTAAVRAEQDCQRAERVAGFLSYARLLAAHPVHKEGRRR